MKNKFKNSTHIYAAFLLSIQFDSVYNFANTQQQNWIIEILGAKSKSQSGVNKLHIHPRKLQSTVLSKLKNKQIKLVYNNMHDVVNLYLSNLIQLMHGIYFCL